MPDRPHFDLQAHSVHSDGSLQAAEVVERADGLSITPAPLHGGVFHTYADHRMAHAGVILGLAVDGVLVEDIATTSKTFPDFAAAWSTAVTGGSSGGPA